MSFSYLLICWPLSSFRQAWTNRQQREVWEKDSNLEQHRLLLVMAFSFSPPIMLVSTSPLNTYDSVTSKGIGQFEFAFCLLVTSPTIGVLVARGCAANHIDE